MIYIKFNTILTEKDVQLNKTETTEENSKGTIIPCNLQRTCDFTMNMFYRPSFTIMEPPS
jgi:hypothetical protein